MVRGLKERYLLPLLASVDRWVPAVPRILGWSWGSQSASCSLYSPMLIGEGTQTVKSREDIGSGIGLGIGIGISIFN